MFNTIMAITELVIIAVIIFVAWMAD